MPPKEYHTLSEFWAAISHSVKGRNYPSYHPCCRVWVARSQRVCRTSHTKKLSWGSVLAAAGFSGGDPEPTLAAHMEEHRWGLPIVMDKHCTAVWSSSHSSQVSREELPEEPKLPPKRRGRPPKKMPVKAVLSSPASPLSTPSSSWGPPPPPAAPPENSRSRSVVHVPDQNTHNHANIAE